MAYAQASPPEALESRRSLARAGDAYAPHFDVKRERQCARDGGRAPFRIFLPRSLSHGSKPRLKIVPCRFLVLGMQATPSRSTSDRLPAHQAISDWAYEAIVRLSWCLFSSTRLGEGANLVNVINLGCVVNEVPDSR